MALWVVTFYTPRTKPASLATTHAALQDQSDPAAQDTARGTIPGLRFGRIYRFPRGVFWPLAPEPEPFIPSFETTTQAIAGARLRQPFHFPRVYLVENQPPMDEGPPVVPGTGDVYVPILRRRRR